MDEKNARKSAEKPRGRPFLPGNSGKPKGCRHKATRAVEELMEGEIENITRKAIDKAKEGDLTAIRLVLDRVCPPRKDRPIRLDLPPMERPKDAVAAIVGAVAEGELSASEAGDLAKLVEAYVRTLVATDIEARLKALEERGSK